MPFGFCFLLSNLCIFIFMKQIPFLDINAVHAELEEAFLEVCRDIIKSGKFIGGSIVDNFERDFAYFCNTKHCIGVGSGTDALRFALLAAGISTGDVVITVPNTFIATTEAITQSGAIPHFIDIDERTYNLDPDLLRNFLENECYLDDTTGRRVVASSKRPVTAIIPVHLYGQMADMDSIMRIAEQYNLIVLEDACQAHGAKYFSLKNGQSQWYTAGSMGKCSAFSFYPGKNLGACGEAGAVTTNDETIAKKIRMIRDHGQEKKYFHEMEGYNGRLDAMQAGFLQIKLRKLYQWNEKRRQIAQIYDELLTGIDEVITPFEPEWSKSVYHLYIIRTQNRNALQEYLSRRHISTGLHYPIPLHLQKAYKKLGYREGDFPVSEKVVNEILSLPMYPDLTKEQQKRVVDVIKEFSAKSKMHREKRKEYRGEIVYFNDL